MGDTVRHCRYQLLREPTGIHAWTLPGGLNVSTDGHVVEPLPDMPVGSPDEATGLDHRHEVVAMTWDRSWVSSYSPGWQVCETPAPKDPDGYDEEPLARVLARFLADHIE